jgi:hypothetical protein
VSAVVVVLAALALPRWPLSGFILGDDAMEFWLLLVRWDHPPLRAFVAALVVASAPCEVLLGTVRANDLFLTITYLPRVEPVRLWRLYGSAAR